MSQQLAHQTINGCNICIGDIMASGTISGKNKSEYGSMLELAWAGTEPLKIGPHMKRSFIEDFDTVIIKGFARQNSLRVGFGQVENMIKPSK